MHHSEIESIVLSIIHDQKTIAEDDLNSETRLDSVGIDSLDALNILFAVEERFSISIPDDEAREIRTPLGIMEAVERHMTADPSA